MPIKVAHGSLKNQSISDITAYKEARNKGVLRMIDIETEGNMPTNTIHISFQTSKVPSL
jgi:hypothetical protein